MIILAIETSCDETAVAILCGERGLLASEVASQIAIHQAYGGVVPEVASRSHLTQLRPVIEAAIERAGVSIHEVDCVSATCGPGLATSLMLGASAAKGLAVGLRKPFLAINHIEGHLLSPFFRFSAENGHRGEILPSVGLVVSGGHTLLVDIKGFGEYQLLGQTHDDAAGEAFDKVGKLLGLPYPAGPVIDQMAKSGDSRRYDFPRSMMDSGDFHFSFSGLKTSVRYMLPKIAGARLEDVCASFQEAVVEVLVAKTINATRTLQRRRIALSGGVSCNSRLRQAMQAACQTAGVELLIAEPGLCTDNAAMIAFVALHQFRHGECCSLSTDINPNLRLV